MTQLQPVISPITTALQIAASGEAVSDSGTGAGRQGAGSHPGDAAAAEDLQDHHRAGSSPTATEPAARALDLIQVTQLQPVISPITTAPDPLPRPRNRPPERWISSKLYFSRVYRRKDRKMILKELKSKAILEETRGIIKCE